MPITQSAKKALRQNRTRRARNTVKKEAYKKAVKVYRKMAVAKVEGAVQSLSSAFKALDKAAKTNVISKNKASRLKSRLSKMIAVKK